MEPKLTNIGLKTFKNSQNKSTKCLKVVNSKEYKGEPLTTKDAVKFLLQGSIKWRVCRFCLSTTSVLSELDEVLEIASSGAMYQVTIRDMIASFYPFQVADDPNFPNKICDKCLDRTINSYLFTQQCERAERALRNCFNDVNEKFDKLDPLERVKRRGRQKLNPNHNVLYVDYKKVMSYADPIINVVNIGSSIEDIEDATKISELECPKCWQVLPNIESFVNHEKIHPKSMWYNCRHCGKSFIKHSQYKKHIKQFHIQGSLSETNVEKRNFTCNECGTVTDSFDRHLQHVEKHKFKNILEHLIEKKMDDLCGVCLDKEKRMVDLNETYYLHGGYPELTGEKTLATALTTMIPEMNSVHNYTGTKICQTCLNHTLTSYIFINKIRYTRNRLQTCISLMLENLDRIDDPEKNVMVEIAVDTILPITEKEVDDDIINENSDIDESKLKIDVLEDEFRIETDSSGEESTISDDLSIEVDKKKIFDDLKKTLYPVTTSTDYILENQAKDLLETINVNKTVNNKLVNGYQSKMKFNNEMINSPVNDVCSEFLTFRKKPKVMRKCKPVYTCPFCSKHFISDYFLKKHVLKHVNIKTNCNVCSDQFKSKFYLFEHMKMVHIANNKEYSVCNVCGRGFCDTSKFSIHNKTHMTKECMLCNKAFASQKRFDNHLHRHALRFNAIRNRKSQTCSFCERECSNDNELSLHVNKSHLQIKPYNCDMCDKQFYTEYNLSSHKRVHGFSSREICEFCDIVFKCRRDLVVHVRKHMGNRPHHCHVCRQSFYSETRQHSHMRKVHGGRFCCRLCKSVFNKKIDLKAHVNVAHNAM